MARIRVFVSVFVVTAACGVLFAVSASTARSTTASGDVSLVALVRNEESDVSSLEDETAQLNATVDSTLAQTEATPSPSPTAVTSLTDVAVKGPGVTVTLNDSPLKTPPDGLRQEDLIIHQQDIEAVMNALWTGGAEAMTVQNKRITSRSVVLCIGNVIYVDGTSFSPPYVISAIGDPDRLKEALASDGYIQTIKQYVARVSLGYDVETNNALYFDAAGQEPPLTDAHKVEDDG